MIRAIAVGTVFAIPEFHPLWQPLVGVRAIGVQFGTTRESVQRPARRLGLSKQAIVYPARIWALTERPDFLGQGAPIGSWHVWSGHSKRASLQLLLTK